MNRIAKTNYLLYAFLFLSAFLYGQQFTNYTTEDGLPSNHIYKITQDEKGFLWIATDKGLVKYNGNSMKIFTTKDGLATNDVWEVFPTPDGKLWYLSKSSKLGYIENDRVYAFESEQKGEIFNPIFSSQVGNTIFLTSSNTFHILKDEKWKLLMTYRLGSSIATNSYIEHPIVSSFKTTEFLDSVFVQDKNNKTIKSYDFKNVLNRIHKRGQITDSLFYWVNDKQYSILNLNTLKLYKRNFKDELKFEQSKHVRINVVNNEIQISGNGFVGVLDADFHIKNTYYIPEHLKAHFGLIDKTGSIWISTFTDGIYYLPIEKQNIKYCLTGDKVNNIKKVNDKIIANVFNKGFYKYEPFISDFSPFIEEGEYLFNATFIDELDTEFYMSSRHVKTVKKNIVKDVHVQDMVYLMNDKARQLVFYNDYLFGQFSLGINKINPNKFSVEVEYLQSGINELLIFNDKFLVATSSGLKEFKNNVFSSILFNNQEFNQSILSINKISKTKILLNTDGFGSYITDLKTIKQLPSSEFLIVNNAYIENNTIWLATESGVLKYTKINDEFVFQMLIDKVSGLPSNSVNNVIVNQENLMVATNNGIAILPINVKQRTQLLDVYIENALFNSQPITDSNSVFKYEDNSNLNFKISNINFAETQKNLSYNYKLEPIYKDWTQTTVSNLNFTNLQPDSYTLFIEAQGFSNKVSFTIQPLWWQKFWFKAFMVLLAIIIIVFISRHFVRRSQFKKNQKIFEDKRLSELQLKALRSQMNPHFVFNSLSAIQYYIGENDFEKSELYLVKFSKLIRQFFELSKENEISLAIELSLLKNYLEIEKLRFKEKLDFTIHVDPNLDTKNTKIPTMLLQPIVENAVNHGIFNKLENGLVILNFIYIEQRTFKVEIIDDGVGFANTNNRQSDDVKSSNVLHDRLHFLNYSEKWEIDYKAEELSPNKADRGNKSVFIITKKQK
ncbi:histidine kinase [Xanthomarina sp. F2636L]|uniref:sensor histidine kinase n=1 Tax=Xanthomarina sp. F2636L TaxID=2996018 RepID=UPI00225DDB1E|nr:histidine kinase [Xanthomarina sp. F2636L]MCX7549872.1 histidine kinase [Xanthomarina sp. F2636L]